MEVVICVGDRVAGNIYTGNNDRRRKCPEEREVRVRYVGDLDIRCKRSAVRKMQEMINRFAYVRNLLYLCTIICVRLCDLYK